MADYFERSLILHEQLRGKISVHNKLPIGSRDDLSLAYTPGVARPCEVIAADPEQARKLTIKGNSVAVVTDGSAVLGLGDIGPRAALPVMEGKALLFREFAKIDAWPICLNSQDPAKIIETCRLIEPVFGGINLEDISAPRCFEIEDALQDLGIPVFHDDQHGTAIVLLAALINSAKVTGKKLPELQVVINGAGAAGSAIAKLIRGIGVPKSEIQPVADVIICDFQLSSSWLKGSVLSKLQLVLTPLTHFLWLCGEMSMTIDNHICPLHFNSDIWILLFFMLCR